MKFFYWLITLAGGWLAFATPLPAAERAPETFLLVVDTSFSMASQKELLQSAARDLLASGMDGQLKPGDKLAIWTFNREANTRQFTPLEWQPVQRAEISARVEMFLTNLVFAKISRLDLAMVEIVNSLEDRAPLTVLLFSDGFEYVWGTTFDAQINRVYRENSARVRREGKSFVTMLRALDGIFVSSRVAILGDTLKLPELPAVSPLAQTIRPPTPPPSTTTSVAPPKPPDATPVAKDSPKTNVVAKATPAVPPETKPVVDAPPPVANTSANEPPTLKPAPVEPKPVIKPEVTVPEKKISAPQSSPVSDANNSAKPNPPPIETPVAAKAESAPAPKSIEKTGAAIPTREPAPAENISAPKPAIVNPPPTVVIPPTPIATTAVQVATTPAPSLVTNSVAPEVSAASSTNSPAPDVNVPTTLAEAALLPPPVADKNRWGYLLLAGAVLLAAGWLGYFFWARAATEPKSSIITRSLDHKRR